ncbi:hypothetical protein JOF53_008123 [Crossiella equi]|uniref:Uncharacterized protein n=1 Tax=Crossiella equi TaxID=130796 RepID=A0ABS5ARR3_9PSEU|nr:hypothetical protein [Crossiella equi]MBP2479251.1 hypothetical protein [Crossiella equi]
MTRPAGFGVIVPPDEDRHRAPEEVPLPGLPIVDPRHHVVATVRAECWRPWSDTCWNTSTSLATGASAAEPAELFAGTARRTYRESRHA